VTTCVRLFKLHIVTTGKGKRVRTIFTPEQLEKLEAEFEKQQYMVGTERYDTILYFHFTSNIDILTTFCDNLCSSV
jgi:hypothetical protein